MTKSKITKTPKEGEVGMYSFIEMILFHLPRIILCSGAVLLAYKGVSFWWVFLIVALFLGGFHTRHPEVMIEYLKTQQCESKNDKK